MTLPSGLKPKNSCYATKEAAQALLARVYLYMENWMVLGIWPMKLLILVVLIYFGVMIIKSTLSLLLKITLKPFLPYVVQN